ncbi:Uncharacterised protein [Serratia quinivorans]|uniref:DUF4760 domain-containing protein n=1 Tax=Serratia quinivorans TaxID=137545 RepID=A0A380ARS1_9GAMM|nr:hypothetical protein [Serratia proteamaculans]RYM60016.1 hypothetical protein BSR03_16305 [Serratia proteamaculans]SUI86294.1 Uncharacterised protein [Serratia quinivorans]
MDSDYISYETLIATRASADWVMYGAIAAWVAAFGAIFTLVYAALALNTWQKQEKTKIRSEFKRSLLALDYAIHMMPDEWSITKAQRIQARSISTPFFAAGDNEAASALSDLKKCWHDAISAWVMCEGLLKKTNLTSLWKELSDIYVDYIKGRVDKRTILNKLADMHSVEFIFN